MAKKSSLYAVIDIETTGGMPRRDKITEIAIVLFDGETIIDRFESLINPERSIPPEITRITGITDAMVADAPKFYEVAKQIVTMTEQAIFVAHNVRFDYGFIKEEFANLGYTFTKKQLCTVVLSRKSFPGLRSYSLGNLIRHFDIKVENRHRAMDDALATVDILGRALAMTDGQHRTQRLINEGIEASHLPVDISIERLHALPETIGVYYMYNRYGQVVYVGKSINIRKRMMQHFGKIDAKTDKFINKVADITYTETGSELISLLLESKEIKLLQPEVNKAQRTKLYPYFIYHYENESGYLCFDFEKSNVKTRQGKAILNHYSSKQSARQQLHFAATTCRLCQCLMGLHSEPESCFYRQTGSCDGAAVGNVQVEEYNHNALIAIDLLNKTFDENFFILTEGRNADEQGLILIEDGHYQGFGYLPNEDADRGVEEWKEAIDYQNPNPESNQIILMWLEKHPFTKMIKY
ncbi:MAG: exonuclease domain-containing protein [Saprospiraceae bacterium]